MKRRYKYGSLGSGDLFWKRLFCRHDWKFMDGYGLLQRCKKCGRYRSRTWKSEVF